MDHHYLTIQLNEIIDSGIYRLHPFLPEDDLDSELTVSIKKFGLLSPPTLIPAIDKTNRFITLCGHRRLKCLHLINQPEVLCRILSNIEEIEEVLTFLAEEQQASGPLTIAESICFLQLCKKHIPDKARLHSYINSLPAVSVPGGYHLLDALGKLCNTVLLAMHKSTISSKTARELLHFSAADQMTLAKLITRFQFGANKQKKLIDMIIDILDRDQASLHELLSSKEIEELLQKPGINEPQRAAKLLSDLDRIKSPKLNLARDQFRQSINRMDLPKNCSVEASQSFESDEVKLIMRFPDIEDFQRKWPRIAEGLELQ